MNAKRSEIVAIADNVHAGACAAFLLKGQDCVVSLHNDAAPGLD
jgi:hypothetical protein